MMLIEQDLSQTPPRILLVAASDQLGCSGIERDAHTVQLLGGHPLRLITGLTLQDNCGLLQAEAVSSDWFIQQLEFFSQIGFSAIKIGAILSKMQLVELTRWLKKVKSVNSEVCVVWDPVMFTSGGRCLCEPELYSLLNVGQQMSGVLIDFLRSVDIVTPNLDEAKRLLGRKFQSHAQLVDYILRWLRQQKTQLPRLGWLQKGGHPVNEQESVSGCTDYYLSANEVIELEGERRHAKFLRGTGCTLATSLATYHALGADRGDALVLSKWTLNEAIDNGYEVIQGNGPVCVKGFPKSIRDFPLTRYFRPVISEDTENRFPPQTNEPAVSMETNTSDPRITPAADPMPVRLSDITSMRRRYAFKKLEPSNIGIYPIVDSAQALQPLIDAGCRMLQLRIKTNDSARLRDEIGAAVAIAREADVPLYINDHWQLAIDFGAYGVHLGQSDLEAEALSAIAQQEMALGISSHNYFEISRALALYPSYLAFGPVFPTQSKSMPWQSQGIERLKCAVKLAECPLVAIGGINHQNIERVARSGASAAAMIAATSGSDSRAKAEVLLARWHNALN